MTASHWNGEHGGMDIERWLLLHLATLAGEPVESIDPRASLAVHDLDSFDAIHMALEIREIFGCEVDPELFMVRDRTVAELVEMLRPFATPAAGDART